MITFDEKKIFSKISQIKPKTILFRGPEGYIDLIQSICSKIENQFNIKTIISADECYGSCDTVENDALMLKADIIFHIGHSNRLDYSEKKTIMIDAYDDVNFTEIIKKSIPIIKKYKNIGLCTISQYLNSLDYSKRILEENGFLVIIPNGEGYLLDGQIMGCRFNTLFKIRNKIEAIIFLGQSRFHAIGASLSTGLPTYILDPYLSIVENMQSTSEKWYRRTFLQIYKAEEAKKFGIIIGLKEGQINLHSAYKLRERLIKEGKQAQLISMREITPNKLDIFTNFDAFIQTACPRISIDGRHFNKVLLSTQQVEGLFDLWHGLALKNFLKKKTWY